MLERRCRGRWGGYVVDRYCRDAGLRLATVVLRTMLPATRVTEKPRTPLIIDAVMQPSNFSINIIGKIFRIRKLFTFFK